MAKPPRPETYELMTLMMLTACLGFVTFKPVISLAYALYALLMYELVLLTRRRIADQIAAQLLPPPEEEYERWSTLVHSSRSARIPTP